MSDNSTWDNSNLDPSHLETLDRDLGRLSTLEQATAYVSRPMMGTGLALIFVVFAALIAALIFGQADNTFIVVIAAAFGAYMALNIGANDVANNMGPAVGANAMSMGLAIVIAAIFESAGALLAGGDVVSTIAKGIIAPESMATSGAFISAMMAALLASALWVNLATWIGAPVSTTHSVVGGVMGAGIAAAGALLTGSEGARSFALTGAVVEMVAHGLITGALFLIAGGVWARAETYEMDRFGGIAQVAPKMTVAATLAAFASLGLPGLAGFVAEVQIFVGAFAVFPWIAAVALLGILITAALFLRMLQQMFFGKLSEARAGFADLAPRETTVLAVLLALVVLIGLWPRWLLTLVDGATQTILGG